MTPDARASARPRAAPGAVLAAGVTALCLAPFAHLGLLSLAGRWPWPDLWPRELRLDRWRALLAGGGELLHALGLSLAVATSVAALATSAGYVTARPVAYHRHRRLLLALAYLPFAVSPVVAGACLLFFYLKAGLAATLPGLVLAHTVVAYAFAVVFWVPFWNAEKRAFEQLVATLGGSPAQLYARVLLPLSRGPLSICFFQTFLLSWFQYGLTLLVGEGRFATLPVLVYAYVNEANPGYAAVASVLLVLPPCALLWVNHRCVVKML